MTQVWHGLVDTLRLLPSINPSVRSTTHAERAREVRQAQGQKKTLDDALDQLAVLIAIRRGERIPSEPLGIPTPTVSTPITSQGGTKRKRRPTVSASPAPTAAQAPHTGGSVESALTPIASPLPRSGTPIGREVTGKQRREMYADQLPLQPGRKVAFKVPGAKHGKEKGGEDDDAESDWILATIQRCILQDKMRYEVEDDDDHTKSASKRVFSDLT